MTKENQNHSKLWEAIDDIRSNHLFHIEKDISEMKTDISWLKKNHWIVMTASVGGLIGALINLL